MNGYNKLTTHKPTLVPISHKKYFIIISSVYSCVLITLFEFSTTKKLFIMRKLWFFLNVCYSNPNARKALDFNCHSIFLRLTITHHRHTNKHTNRHPSSVKFFFTTWTFIAWLLVRQNCIIILNSFFNKIKDCYGMDGYGVFMCFFLAVGEL